MSSSARSREIFLLRLTGAILASAAFGLIAASAFSHWNFWAAVGLGFPFGTAFIGGTGYRIIFGVLRRSTAPAPASWSGATVGSALYAAALWAVAASLGLDGAFVLLAYGVAINIAYLPVKRACLQVGCCAVAHGYATPANLDLRKLEIAMTIGILAASAALAALNLICGGFKRLAQDLPATLFKVARRVRPSEQRRETFTRLLTDCHTDQIESGDA